MQSIGVSVSFIQQFLSAHFPAESAPPDQPATPSGGEQPEVAEPEPAAEPEVWTSYDVVERVIKVQTAQKQTHYADMFIGKVDAGGRALVKEANTYVSHSWGSDCRAMLQALVQYNAAVPAKRDRYFWVDLFVVNQHSTKVAEDVEEFADDLNKCIAGCGNFLQVLTNWESPLSLSRLWCVWEIFCARSSDVPIQLVQPATEQSALLDHLLEKGLNSPDVQSYFRPDCRKAEASHHIDSKKLKEAIEKFTGYSQLNETIKELIRVYLVETCKKQLELNEEIQSNPGTLSRYGDLISSLSVWDTEYLKELFQKCLKLFQEVGKESWNSEIVVCYTNLGEVCRKANMINEAIQYLFKALESEQKRIQIERRSLSVRLADIFLELGGTYKQTGRYNEALEALIRANQIYETHGNTWEKQLRTQRKIGLIYNKLGKYSLAGRVYQDVINDAPEPNSIGIALAKSQLGDVLVNEGSHYFGLQQINAALDSFRDNLGEEAPLVADTLNKRGEVFRMQGKLRDALEDQQLALRIKQTLFGQGHPKTGSTLGYLAAIKRSEGDFNAATEMYQDVLEVQGSFCSEDMSLDIATTHCNLAGVFIKIERYDHAVTHLTEALKIRTEVLREDHPDIAPIFFNLAKIFSLTGKLEKAVNFANKCLHLEMTAFSDPHHQVGTTFCLLGDLFTQLKKHELALEAYENGASVWGATLPSNHPHVTNLKSTIQQCSDRVHAKEKRRQELIRAAKPSMKGQIRMSGLLQPAGDSVYYNIAKLFDHNGHSAEALAMYRRFLSHVQTSLPHEHPRVRTAKARIRSITHPQDPHRAKMIPPKPVQGLV